MPMIMRYGAILAAAMLLAACETPDKTRWVRPGGTGPKPTDLATCRADANRRAEREFLLDTESRNDPDFATPGNIRNELAKRDAKRFRQRIYEECLRGLGYRKGPDGADTTR